MAQPRESGSAGASAAVVAPRPAHRGGRTLAPSPDTAKRLAAQPAIPRDIVRAKHLASTNVKRHVHANVDHGSTPSPATPGVTASAQPAVTGSAAAAAKRPSKAGGARSLALPSTSTPAAQGSAASIPAWPVGSPPLPFSADSFASFQAATPGAESWDEDSTRALLGAVMSQLGSEAATVAWGSIAGRVGGSTARSAQECEAFYNALRSHIETLQTARRKLSFTGEQPSLPGRQPGTPPALDATKLVSSPTVRIEQASTDVGAGAGAGAATSAGAGAEAGVGSGGDPDAGNDTESSSSDEEMEAAAADSASEFSDADDNASDDAPGARPTRGSSSSRGGKANRGGSGNLAAFVPAGLTERQQLALLLRQSNPDMGDDDGGSGTEAAGVSTTTRRRRVTHPTTDTPTTTRRRSSKPRSAAAAADASTPAHGSGRSTRHDDAAPATATPSRGRASVPKTTTASKGKRKGTKKKEVVSCSNGQVWKPPEFFTWPSDRKKSWEGVTRNPNAYYLKYLPPGESPNVGKWSGMERRRFIICVKTHPPGKLWGLFSMNIPGRTGKECEKFYNELKAAGDAPPVTPPRRKPGSPATTRPASESLLPHPDVDTLEPQPLPQVQRITRDASPDPQEDDAVAAEVFVEKRRGRARKPTPSRSARASSSSPGKRASASARGSARRATESPAPSRVRSSRTRRTPDQFAPGDAAKTAVKSDDGAGDGAAAGPPASVASARSGGRRGRDRSSTRSRSKDTKAPKPATTPTKRALVATPPATASDTPSSQDTKDTKVAKDRARSRRESRADKKLRRRMRREAKREARAAGKPATHTPPSQPVIQAADEQATRAAAAAAVDRREAARLAKLQRRSGKTKKGKPGSSVVLLPTASRSAGSAAPVPSAVSTTAALSPPRRLATATDAQHKSPASVLSSISSESDIDIVGARRRLRRLRPPTVAVEEPPTTTAARGKKHASNQPPRRSAASPSSPRHVASKRKRRDAASAASSSGREGSASRKAPRRSVDAAPASKLVAQAPSPSVANTAADDVPMASGADVALPAKPVAAAGRARKGTASVNAEPRAGASSRSTESSAAPAAKRKANSRKPRRSAVLKPFKHEFLDADVDMMLFGPRRHAHARVATPRMKKRPRAAAALRTSSTDVAPPAAIDGGGPRHLPHAPAGTASMALQLVADAQTVHEVPRRAFVEATLQRAGSLFEGTLQDSNAARVSAVEHPSGCMRVAMENSHLSGIRKAFAEGRATVSAVRTRTRGAQDVLGVRHAQAFEQHAAPLHQPVLNTRGVVEALASVATQAQP